MIHQAKNSRSARNSLQRQAIDLGEGMNQKARLISRCQSNHDLTRWFYDWAACKQTISDGRRSCRRSDAIYAGE